MGFLNGTGAEIGYQLDKKCSKIIFKKPTPSQMNLIRNAKNYFLLLEKLKNTERSQLCKSAVLETFCRKKKKGK